LGLAIGWQGIASARAARQLAVCLQFCERSASVAVAINFTFALLPGVRVVNVSPIVAPKYEFFSFLF
jgi:hypothetical protein